MGPKELLQNAKISGDPTFSLPLAIVVVALVLGVLGAGVQTLMLGVALERHVDSGAHAKAEARMELIERGIIKLNQAMALSIDFRARTAPQLKKIEERQRAIEMDVHVTQRTLELAYPAEARAARRSAPPAAER